MSDQMSLYSSTHPNATEVRYKLMRLLPDHNPLDIHIWSDGSGQLVHAYWRRNRWVGYFVTSSDPTDAELQLAATRIQLDIPLEVES